jgi:hypothetical protein
VDWVRRDEEAIAVMFVPKLAEVLVQVHLDPEAIQHVPARQVPWSPLAEHGPVVRKQLCRWYPVADIAVGPAGGRAVAAVLARHPGKYEAAYYREHATPAMEAGLM